MSEILAPEQRWEQGIPHHPKSVEIVRFLIDYDREHCDWYFDWKMGGDGENGEELAYQLDAYFESKEQEAEE